MYVLLDDEELNIQIKWATTRAAAEAIFKGLSNRVVIWDTLEGWRKRAVPDNVTTSRWKDYQLDPSRLKATIFGGQSVH